MASAKDRHQEVFIERNEDTRTRKRTVPLEVLSLGFSRTGTMSMKAALETLGYPTWHWVTMSENTPDLAMWTEALEATWVNDKPFGRQEFDNLLGRWGATTDQPVSFLAKEILNAYPDVKVILVERDVDRWYKSFCEGVINSINNPFIPLAAAIDRTYLGQMNAQMDLISRHYFGVDESHTKYGLINNPDYFDAWKAKAKGTYRAHNERIKQIVPKQRLLLFQLDQGWEPLCEFLDKPVPEVPFPRINETAAIQEKINLYIGQSYKRTAVKFVKRATPLVALLTAVIVWKFMR